MRAIWIDHVRRDTAIKRGGPGHDAPLELAEGVPAAFQPSEDWLALDQALDRLDAINPRQREVVELRYFAGLEFAEIAELLQCSERTAKREWERARAVLYALMK
jgi:RNA polymerase sigma factor (TIGR02999 family)